MNIFCDWKVNSGRVHIQVGLLLFRIAQISRRNYGRVSAPLSILYRAFSLFSVGFDIPVSTCVGERLRIHHGMALVVNSKSRIGNDVTLRQSTTIGSSVPGGASPVIGDGVEIGANAVIVGDVKIGDFAVIGAGSVVVSSVANGERVVGNPGRVLLPRRE